MPTTLSALDPLTGEVKVRWKETFLTEGLNSKFAGIVPRGIHRGFRLATSATNLTVTVTADTLGGDHVAQYLTTAGQALTLRRVGGNFSLLLAASSTLVIALYATYSTYATTTAEVRSYTLAEFNALSLSARTELVVLGTVTTPGSGVIPAASITHDRRVNAWAERGPEASDWQPLLMDSTFDLSELGAISPAWFASAGANATWATINTDPAGERALQYTSGSASTLSNIALAQALHTPVEAGQDLYCRVSVKNLQSGTGTVTLKPLFTDSAGAGVTEYDVMTIISAASGVDSSYVTYEKVFRVPVGAVNLQRMSLAGSMTYAGSFTPSILIKDLQVWLSPPAAKSGANIKPASQHVLTTAIRLANLTTILAATDPVITRYGSGDVQIKRATGTGIDPALVLWGQLSLRGQRVVTTDVALNSDDLVILVDNTALRTITLPDPLNQPILIFKALSPLSSLTGNYINLVPFGAELIDGAAGAHALSTNTRAWILISDGTNWHTLSPNTDHLLDGLYGGMWNPVAPILVGGQGFDFAGIEHRITGTMTNDGLIENNAVINVNDGLGSIEWKGVTGRPLLGSRTISRSMWHPWADPAKFAIYGSYAETLTLLLTSEFYMNFEPPHGATLTQLSLRFIGALSGPAVPTSPPQLAVFKTHISTGVVTQLGATAADPSAGVAANYTVIHIIAVTGLAEVIDRESYVYHAVLISPQGGNTATLAKIYPPLFTCTITQMDDGAS